jgi:hypothetical protein
MGHRSTQGCARASRGSIMRSSMRSRRSLALLAALVATAALAGGASAAPSLLVGVSDDHLKTDAQAGPAVRDLGLSAVRLTLDWRPGQVTLGNADVVSIQKALNAGTGARIVVLLYPDEPWDAPKTAEAREQFCATARSILASFPQINDVVIGNEPNKSTFWKPQFNADGSSASPAAYAALLAHCHAVLHAFRPGVNVIHAGLSSTGNDRPDASSNISHSPGNFNRQEGKAFRAGLAGRAPAGLGVQLFDTFGFHPYGESSTEPVWKRHDASSTIGLADWDKLMQALWDAFQGTSQPIPGEGVPIWYLEIGFQTSIDPSKAGKYRGSENTETVSPIGYGGPARTAGAGVPDQATQLGEAIRMAYCQPYVEAVFNFLLRDEIDLDGWQSAPIWVDWTPKGSYAALQQTIRQVRSGAIACGAVPGGPFAFQPKAGVDVERVVWSKARTFNWKNDLWRFRVQTGENASYTATLFRLAQAGSAKSAGARAPVLTASGQLRKLYFSWVTFPRRRLAPGRYAIEVVLVSQENTARSTRVAGPAFTVLPRR